MNIFLINLDKDKDRLAAMSAQLASLKLPFERIEAVYGTKMPDWIKPYFLDGNGAVASDLLVGEVGCYASHLMLHDRIVKSGVPALVLEDDLEFSPDFASILQAIDRLPAGWEIIRLTNPFKRRFFRVANITEKYDAVKFSSVSPSTGAYLITPEGARKFLKWKLLRTLPVDQDMRRTWDCKLITYGIFPRPVISFVGKSSIDGMSRRGKKSGKKASDFKDEWARMTHDIKWLGLRNWLVSLIFRSSNLTSLWPALDREDTTIRQNPSGG